MRSIFTLALIIVSLHQTLLAQGRSDSIITNIASKYDSVSSIHRFFWGDSYRKLYNTPVQMPILDLSKFNGGLSVVKLGGGMQTQSLRLVDAAGREWVLRSIEKYPERSLPEQLRNTIAKDIVQDQIAIAHPYGALTVPTFNNILGVPHAAPRLVYVGDDPALGEYREIFKHRAYMFEPRVPFEDVKSDNTAKVIRKSLEDNDVTIDQKIVLRSRLLDFIMGDWDRHEDNYRWNPIKNNGDTHYEPIPRDRDKVYYKTSGVFPLLLSYQYLKANAQPFSSTIRNIEHWNFNARHFDRFFLNEMDRKDWMKQIALLQKSISDSVIRKAMSYMPDTIQKLSSAELIYNITARRDSLERFAIDYYLSLSKNVDIALSQKTEFIYVDILEDGAIAVKINNKKKDGSEGRELYKRKFYPEETQEIRIYGIAGADEYVVNAVGKSTIKVRLIGGKDKDSYTFDNSKWSNNSIYIYDQKNKLANNLPRVKGIKYRLSNDSLVNDFDYNQFVYDRKGLVVDVNYGVDRGLILGLGYLIQNQSFRKKPYGYSHKILGSYLTGRKSFMLEYEGIYKEFWKKNDLLIQVSSLGPKNLSNFFGYGNNTIFIKEDDELNDIDYGIDYYRSRYDMVDANILFQKRLNPHIRYHYGIANSFYTSNKGANDERFLLDFAGANPSENVFGTKFFSGASLGIEYDSRDQKEFPQSGLFVNTDMKWNTEIGTAKYYFKSTNSLSFYQSFLNNQFTIANRIGADVVWGNPYFFQHAQIGGELSLRGYNSRRFTGTSSFYNNLDLRVKLWRLESRVFPATFGAIGFYDIGRVWMANEKSSSWHQGMGGGIYLSPADLFVVQAVVGVSKEAVLPYIRIGVSF